MKYIQKRMAPESLEEYKSTQGASFEGLPSAVKEQLKKYLIEEQGGLCCYCGCRITYDSAMIEHFRPKKRYPDLQLEYLNLLSSCFGGQIDRRGNRRFPLSCDAKKNDRIIDVSPTDPQCETYFSYDDDGNIYGETEESRYAVEILGLNNEVLKNRRKAAIDVYIDLPLETDWEKEIEYLSMLGKNGEYVPYCFAVIYYIRYFKLMEGHHK